MTVLAYDLCAGARGWEAGNEDLDVATIGFDVDPDACATARAAGLHAVQDDIARLVPEIVALVYGQPEGLIGSPPCQLFSAAGKGIGRQLMEELHRAITDAARGASDIVMARHRRELRRLLYKFLRETEGVGSPDPKHAGRKRPRASRNHRRDGKPCGVEATPIRRGELRAEADRMARNVSLVWQPARWAARLRPRWIALEQVPAVLPLWEAMARGLEVHGYRCWTGVLLAERYGVPQTRKRAILLASLDGQPQPPEATHQAYVPGEPARAGEPDLFGPGLQPWVSMAEALGWGAGRYGFPRRDDTGTSEDGYRERDWRSTDEPAFGLTEKARSFVYEPDVDPADVEVELARSEGSGPRRARNATEPAPTIRGGAGGGCGTNLEIKPTLGAQGLAKGRDVWREDLEDPDASWNRSDLGQAWPGERPAPTVTGSRRSRDGMLVGRQLPEGERDDVGGWPDERPATTVAGDPRVFPPGHKVNADDLAHGRGGQKRSGAGHTDGTARDAAVRVSVGEAAALQSFPPDWPWWACRSRTAAFQAVGNAIPPLLARVILQAAMAPTRRLRDTRPATPTAP